MSDNKAAGPVHVRIEEKVGPVKFVLRHILVRALQGDSITISEANLGSVTLRRTTKEPTA